MTERGGGFDEQFITNCPRGKGRHRKKRRLWLTVKAITGSPPTLIHYQPARRWYDTVEGEREFLDSARWTIHHERGQFVFHGKIDAVLDEVKEVMIDG